MLSSSQELFTNFFVNNYQRVIVTEAGTSCIIKEPDFANMPRRLKRMHNWLAVKGDYKKKKKSTWKLSKVPYRRGIKVSVTRRENFMTFEEAKAEYEQGDYIGIAFVLRKGCGVSILDIDNCVREDGTLEEWVKLLLQRFPSYAEISVSGKGLHIILLGSLPKNIVKHPFELYTEKRMVLITGHKVNQHAIAYHQDELYKFAAELESLQQETKRKKIVRKSNFPAPVLNLSDEELIARAKKAQNGLLFSMLWEGNYSLYNTLRGINDDSQNEADLALADILTFWTGGDKQWIDRLFRQSGLYRAKWDEMHGEKTYGEGILDLATNQVSTYYKPGKSFSITIIHANRKPFDQKTQQQMLTQKREERKAALKKHLQEGNSTLLFKSTPGVGKSHDLAEIASELDKPIDYILQRHSQVTQITPLMDISKFMEIMPPSEENCPCWEDHQKLIDLGLNVSEFHRKHRCKYWKQFQDPRNLIWQMNHLESMQAGKRECIVDDMNFTDQVKEEELDWEKATFIREKHIKDKTVKKLLTGISKMLSYAQDLKLEDDAPKGIQGKAFIELLQKFIPGRLKFLLEELMHNAHVISYKPAAKDIQDTDELEKKSASVMLSTLVHALHEDSRYWNKPDWNSAIRLDLSRKKPKIIITKAINLEQLKGHANIIANATLHQEYMERLHQQQFTLLEEEVEVASNTFHYNYKKHCGKYQVEHAKGKDMDRILGRCNFILNYMDPDRKMRQAGEVGLITYKSFVKRLAKAVGISEKYCGSFWAISGSNQLQECKLLLIYGTPTVAPQDIYRIARFLYRGDTPIIEKQHLDTETHTWVYDDERCQKLNKYISSAELTQCAHRTRPVRHGGRIVITFADAETTYLPVTHRIEGFSEVDQNGVDMKASRLEEAHVRLEKAYTEMTEAGEKITLKALNKKAGVASMTGSLWLREKRAAKESSIKPEIFNTLYSTKIGIENPVLKAEESASTPPRKLINRMPQQEEWNIDEELEDLGCEGEFMEALLELERWSRKDVAG